MFTFALSHSKQVQTMTQAEADALNAKRKDTRRWVRSDAAAPAAPAPAAKPDAIAETNAYRLEGSDRVENLTASQVKARNAARSDGKKWVRDDAAKASAVTPKTPPAGAERQKLIAAGNKRDAADAEQRAAKAAGATTRKDGKPKQMSGLDAAAQVLKDAGKPMNAKEIVEAMFAAKLWSSGGLTPHATIYAAMIREIDTKGSDARFIKAERGKFTARA